MWSMTPHDGSGHIVDAGAIVLWMSTFFNVLPSIAALLSVIWITLRILETRTVQQILGPYAWVRGRKSDNEDSEF